MLLTLITIMNTEPLFYLPDNNTSNDLITTLMEKLPEQCFIDIRSEAGKQLAIAIAISTSRFERFSK